MESCRLTHSCAVFAWGTSCSNGIAAPQVRKLHQEKSNCRWCCPNTCRSAPHKMVLYSLNPYFEVPGNFLPVHFTGTHIRLWFHVLFLLRIGQINGGIPSCPTMMCVTDGACQPFCEELTNHCIVLFPPQNCNNSYVAVKEPKALKTFFSKTSSTSSSPNVEPWRIPAIITGVRNNQNLIWCVKIGVYMGFIVHCGSWLLWPPVIGCLPKFLVGLGFLY